MKKKFCVIGDKAHSANVTRTWCVTPEEAETHAKQLLRNKQSEGTRPSQMPHLFVVEVIKVVGFETKPIKIFNPDEFDLLD